MGAARKRSLDVQIRTRYRPLSLRAVIRRALVAAAAYERVPGGSSVGVLVCDDATMRDYNRRFAGEDHTTDVLSFAAGGGSELGDIILSLDRLQAQASQAGHTAELEAATLAVHGFLHLLGYDHTRKPEERFMFARTSEIVEGLGLPG